MASPARPKDRAARASPMRTTGIGFGPRLRLPDAAKPDNCPRLFTSFAAMLERSDPYHLYSQSRPNLPRKFRTLGTVSKGTREIGGSLFFHQAKGGQLGKR